MSVKAQERRRETSNIISLRRRKPRTYTSAEEVLDAVRERIFVDGRTYRAIAHASNLSPTTIANIAYGYTTWPRHTTLFPIMLALGMKMKVYHEDDE